MKDVKVKLKPKLFKFKVSESDVKKLLTDRLRIDGWFIFHILQGLGSFPGITDFIAVKGGRVLFIETKSPKGTQRPDQIIFQNIVESHGGEYWLIDCFEDIVKMIGDPIID